MTLSDVRISELTDIVIRNSHLAYTATRKSRDPTFGTTVGRQPIQLQCVESRFAPCHMSVRHLRDL